MISIFFNGEEIKIPKNKSLTDLLIDKNCKIEYCAIALNRQFIPRVQHAVTFLKDNDVIEMITPMQGG